MSLGATIPFLLAGTLEFVLDRNGEIYRNNMILVSSFKR